MRLSPKTVPQTTARTLLDMNAYQWTVLLAAWLGRVVPERSPTLMRECFESVRPYGYPDFAT